jgi:hypothetical protein
VTNEKKSNRLVDNGFVGRAKELLKGQVTPMRPPVDEGKEAEIDISRSTTVVKDDVDAVAG